jgi:hypothetical protein
VDTGSREENASNQDSPQFGLLNKPVVAGEDFPC